MLLVQRSTFEGSCKDNSCREQTDHADNGKDDGLLVEDNHCLFLYIEHLYLQPQLCGIRCFGELW